MNENHTKNQDNIIFVTLCMVGLSVIVYNKKNYEFEVRYKIRNT